MTVMGTRRRELLKIAGGGLAALSIAPSVASASSDGWRSPRYDSRNTAATTGGPEVGVRELWSSTAGVVGTPVVDDGTVYAVSSGGTLRAFDATDGDELWSFGADDSAESSVSFDDGTVVFTAGPTTYAVDADTGEEEWSHRGRGVSSSAPNVVDGRVYVGKSNRLYSLGLHTGTEVWYYEGNGPVAGTPAVDDGTVYFGDGDGYLYAVDDEGGLDWRSEVSGSVPVAPVVTDDYVFAVTSQAKVVCFGRSDGDEEWSEELFESVSSPPAVDDDHIYVPTEDGNVYALRTTSGWEDWSFSRDGSPSAPAVGDELVYVGVDGAMYGVNAETGDDVWIHEEPSVGAPAVVGEDIYFGDSSLQAVHGGVPSPETSVADVSVGRRDLDVGDSVDVTVTVENTGNADGTQPLTLYVDGESVDSDEVDVEADGSTETTLTASFDEAGVYGIRVNDIDSGDVTVGEGDEEELDDTDEADGDADEEQETDAETDDATQPEGVQIPLPGFGAPVAVVAAAAVAAKRFLSDEDS